MASTSKRARRRESGSQARNVAIVIAAVVALGLAVWQGYRFVAGPQVVIAPGGPTGMNVTAESEGKPPPFGTPQTGPGAARTPPTGYTAGEPGMEGPPAVGGTGMPTAAPGK